MKEMLEEYIQTRISTPIESVLLKESLDENMITQINNLNDEALFFIVNNLYVNPTKVVNGEILANKLTTILGMPKENLLSSFVILGLNRSPPGIAASIWHTSPTKLPFSSTNTLWHPG